MKTKRVLKYISFGLCCLMLTFCVPLLTACGFDDTVKKASKNLNSYAISATLEGNNKVTATAEIKIKNRTNGALPELWFHLYGRAFREGARVLPYSASSTNKCFPNGLNYGNLEVTAVTSGGAPCEYSYGGQDQNVLIVKKSLEKNQEVTIKIDYILTLAETTHRLGHFEDNVNLGNWYPVLCVYENGEYVADPYYATGDPFYSECANYSVELTYPSEYVLANSGQVKSNSQDGQIMKTKMEARAVRDFALVLSKKFEVKSQRTGNTTITYLGYKGDSDIDANLQTAVKALKTFNSLFGEYPYRTLTVAKTPFLFGGMEYPNLVWVADNITDPIEKAKVIAHEIAHQWWYGLVGNNEVKYSYIDEAMAEYSTVLFFEKNSGYNYSGKQMVQDAALSYQLYSEVIESIKGNINDTLNQPTTEFSTEYEYVYVVYVRGTLFLDALRSKVKDKEFLGALRSYYKKFKFKNATRDDFLGVFSRASGDDIGDIFKEWKA